MLGVVLVAEVVEVAVVLLSENVEFILLILSVQSEFTPIRALVIILVIQSVVCAISELSGTKLICPYERLKFEP